MLLNVSKFSVGITLDAPQTFLTSSSIIMSAVFTYSPGTSVNVEYALRQSSSDILSIFLYNTHSGAEVLLWQSTPYAIYGVLHSCITLPNELAMQDVKIKVEFTSGDVLWGGEDDGQTALRRLMILKDPCPGILHLSDVLSMAL